MSDEGPLIRSISDTALWVAVYRARETERADALFCDPFARRLAGQRGEQISATMPFLERNSWSIAARTYLFDQFIEEQIHEGVDMVINLAAGLDARPYRMSLPPSLQWVEVELLGILDYKEQILAREKPRCALDRIHLDLSDAEARRGVLEQLRRKAKRTLIVSEGLVIYLAGDIVASLAGDLASPPSFQRWVLDTQSPGLLRMAQKQMAAQLGQGGASLGFGPKEGPVFFEQHDWTPIDVRSILKTAARLKRLSLGMRLLSFLPESSGA
jgi:methyltransferase (TIGR00027 family)